MFLAVLRYGGGEEALFVDGPFIAISPAARFGRPTVGRSRLSVDAVATAVWAERDVDSVAEDYGVSRADVLVACWYAGTYGLAAGPKFFPTRLWVKRWGGWAESVTERLWAGVVTVEDPPMGEL